MDILLPDGGRLNFVGAGVFGFLINLPIVCYFEVGTMLTPNHAHPAFMGVFGMLAVALMVFAFRQVTPDERWPDTEKYIRISFWRLNVGLAMMILSKLSGRRSALARAQRSVRAQPADARARMSAASWRFYLHHSGGHPTRDRRT